MIPRGPGSRSVAVCPIAMSVPQRRDLAVQLLDLGMLLARQPGALAGVDLRAAHARTQRLRAIDPQLGHAGTTSTAKS
jgi:hypothetical protein